MFLGNLKSKTPTGPRGASERGRVSLAIIQPELTSNLTLRGSFHLQD